LGEGALLAFLLRGGLVQYPDVKLYNAAVQLPAADRPTKPVRLGDASNMPVFKSNPNLAAISNADKPDRPIFVNTKTREYADTSEDSPLILASVLAHEAQHLKTGYAEAPAYAKAIDFLQSTRLKDSPYVNELKRIAEKHRNDK
jgi:hypothetical protein